MMRGSLKKLFALLLALSMLFALPSCGLKSAQQNDKIESLTIKDEAAGNSEISENETAGIEESRAPEYKKFSDMEYARPDTEAFRTVTEHAVEVLNSDAPYEEICKALDACEAEYSHFDTMYVIAEIRSCMDMTDEFYAAEYAWVEENQAVFDKLEDHVLYAAAANQFAEKLEEDYYWEGFAEAYADESESIYTERYMELARQESEILAEYRNLIAAPTILYRGEERDFNELCNELFNEDYNGYLAAVEKYYKKYNARLSEIYIGLVEVRNLIADELGYESYEEYAYKELYGRDYSPEEAEILVQAVRQYAVPAYEKINSKHSYNDVDYFNLSEKKLLEAMDNFTGNMGGDIRAAYEFMLEYELYDVSVSSKKADMSFETYIGDYQSPFILSDCFGDGEDIITFAHEFGHFTCDYVNYGTVTGLDVQETFSQAMEYLCLSYLESDAVVKGGLDSLILMKLLDTYSSYTQAGYAEFEHRIYSMDAGSLTAEVINDIWLEICQDYGMCLKGYETLYRMGWMDVPHFFEYPFYVISYTVSNEAALQVFQLERENSGAGLEIYNRMLLSGNNEFLSFVKECGLESPFSADRVKKSADFLLDISENVL